MNTSHRTNKQLLWTILISFLAAVVVGVVCIVYTGYVDGQSNRRWCELLTTMDSAYESTPPQTAVGHSIATEIHRLRLAFEC